MMDFDLKITNNEYSVNLNEIGKLFVKQYNSSIAVLYFTDYLNNKINIPEKINVFTYDLDNKKILVNPNKNEYLLCFTEKYEIEHDNFTIFVFEPQRKWKMFVFSKYLPELDLGEHT